MTRIGVPIRHKIRVGLLASWAQGGIRRNNAECGSGGRPQKYFSVVGQLP